MKSENGKEKLDEYDVSASFNDHKVRSLSEAEGPVYGYVTFVI